MVQRRPAARLLGGQIVEWVRQREVIARLRLVELPAKLELTLREDAPGVLRLMGHGLVTGWRATLAIGTAQACATADGDGKLDFPLDVAGNPPSLVSLHLYDLASGRSLALEAAWPSHHSGFLGPDGWRLDRDRSLSLDGLSSWRGVLPQDKGGTVQIRLPPSANNAGTSVGFAATGEVRLGFYEPTVRQLLALGGADARVQLRLVSAGSEGQRLDVCRYDWKATPRNDELALGTGDTKLCALALDGEPEVRTIEAIEKVGLRDWLGEAPTLWFVQASNAERGVMRPIAWNAHPAPHESREARIVRFAKEWRELVATPGDPEWGRRSRLFKAAREAGSAVALDQIQALARAPAAAVVLLLRAARDDVATMLALEGEAPIWWPLVPVSAWRDAVAHYLSWKRASLLALDLPESEAERGLALRAYPIVAVRPELVSHLRYAFKAAGLPPFALDRAGVPFPLWVQPSGLETEAEAMVKRAPIVPDGCGWVVAGRSRFGDRFNPIYRPVLHAPFVVAEVAAGVRPPPSTGEMLQLIALRLADTIWFDAAVPLALAQAMEAVHV